MWRYAIFLRYPSFDLKCSSGISDPLPPNRLSDIRVGLGLQQSGVLEAETLGGVAGYVLGCMAFGAANRGRGAAREGDVREIVATLEHSLCRVANRPSALEGIIIAAEDVAHVNPAFSLDPSRSPWSKPLEMLSSAEP